MKKKLQEAFRFIEEKTPEMLNLWVGISEIESGPDNTGGVDSVQKSLENYCSSIGMETRVYEFEKAGNSLVAFYEDHKEDIPGVAFMGHMDTVHSIGRFGKSPVRIEEDLISGPGVLDCKGGLIVGLLAARALKHIGESRPVKLVYSGDEEIGHGYSEGKGADVFLNEVKGFAAAFNCETGFTDNRIVVGRKGGAQYKIKIKGKAAHAGNEPQKGISAIKEAAYKIIDIEKHTDYDGITYNVGIIEGGTVSNSIPEECILKIDVRFVKNDDVAIAEKILQEITDTCYIEGTESTLEKSYILHPMEKDDKNMKLFEIVKENSEKLGFGTPYPCYLGGGSDAAYSVIAGVPSVCAMGVKGFDNHTLRERAVISSLPERAKLLVASVLSLPADFS